MYSQAGKHKISFTGALMPQETMWKKQLKFGFGVVPELNIREIFASSSFWQYLSKLC